MIYHDHDIDMMIILFDSDRNVAPKLAATAKQLERSLIADRLSEQLSERDNPSQLRNYGVLKGRKILVCVFVCFKWWLLVVGCWLLVVGCWLLVVGCWLLVVGCCFDFNDYT